MNNHLSVTLRVSFQVVFASLVLALSTARLRAADISGSDLTGTVRNTEGDPVSGATVVRKTWGQLTRGRCSR